MSDRLQFRVHDDRNLVVLVFSGPITDDELLAGIDEVMATIGWSSSMDVLADMRGITGDSVTLDGLVKLASKTRELQDPPARRSALVASEDHRFAMARQYASIAAKGVREIRAFRDLGDALEWLGHPDLELD